MLFDVQAELAEILSDPPAIAISAISAIPRGQIAEIAEIATPSAKFPYCAEVVPFPKEPIAPDHLPVTGPFPHGRCQLSGGPRTWTGRIVNLTEWRELSDWDKNGSTGKLWNGLTRQWEHSGEVT